MPERSIIDTINERNALVKFGGKARILHEGYDPVFKRQSVTYLSRQDFETVWFNHKVKVEGEDKPKGAGAYWLGSKKRREYEGVVFMPRGGTPENYYNLWKGWAVKPENGCYTLFAEFVRDVICNEDEELYEYVWCWLAHMFQKPGELPGTCLVMRGGQGIGKSAFMKIIGRLVGQHYAEITSMEHITGRFNAHLQNVLLLFANEAVWGGDKTREGALKAMITDKMVLIEHKGLQPEMGNNYKRVVIASNENWAAPRAVDDRRFICLDVSDSRRLDAPYFDEIFREADDGGYEAILHALLNVPLDDWNPRNVPESVKRLGADLKIQSGSSALQWWESCLDSGVVIPEKYGENDRWPERVLKKQVYKAYLWWCKDRNISRPEGDSQWAKEVMSYGGVTPRRLRNDSGNLTQYYLFTPLQDAQKNFIDFAKLPTDYYSSSD